MAHRWDRQKSVIVLVCVCVCVCVWMDGSLDGWMGGWVGGWVGGLESEPSFQRQLPLLRWRSSGSRLHRQLRRRWHLLCSDEKNQSINQ